MLVIKVGYIMPAACGVCLCVRNLQGYLKPVSCRRGQCVHGEMVCRAIKERNAIKT